MKRIGLAVALLAISVGFACDGTDRAEADRVRAATERALEEAERARKAEEDRARRESLARRYAGAAGEQIMEAIGGGQDLIAMPREWAFDEYTGELTIPMDVSFNGRIIRSNNYQVSGILTVMEDGTNPEFARATANQNYLDQETMIRDITIAGGVVGGTVLVLKALMEEDGGG